MTTHRPLHGVDVEVRAELYRETHLPTATSPGSTAATDGSQPRGRPHIVVGTDGSGPAQAAVAWALAEAARTGARLTLLRTWLPGEPVGGPLLGRTVVGQTPPADELVLEMETQVDELRRRPEAAAVRIDALVLGGAAQEILLGESQDADLVVVGSRGRGALRSALLGSVSLQVAAKAACPVVVVPAPQP